MNFTLALLLQILTPPLEHHVTVVQGRLNFPLIQWKVVIRFCPPQPLTVLTTNLGQARTRVGMRLTWNRTQVRPNSGNGPTEETWKRSFMPGLTTLRPLSGPPIAHHEFNWTLQCVI